MRAWRFSTAPAFSRSHLSTRAGADHAICRRSQVMLRSFVPPPASNTVGKASLTVTANNDAKTYDGLAYTGGNFASTAASSMARRQVLGDAGLYGDLAERGQRGQLYDPRLGSAPAITRSAVRREPSPLTRRRSPSPPATTRRPMTVSPLRRQWGGLQRLRQWRGQRRAGATLAYTGTSQGAVNAGSYSILGFGADSAITTSPTTPEP